MTLQIQLPDEIARRLEKDWPDLNRKTVESLAMLAYREGLISERQLGEMLGLESREDVYAWLDRNQAPRPYTVADLEADLASVEGMRLSTALSPRG
ncbi:MAG: UPF0175 family protein [Acidobacteria bacterium]|nr:UPF0175 family protein [Acidobacteriota bacterium]